MMYVASPAKINLTLDILGRRPDGYHQLSSVVHTIGLYDSLTFELIDGASTVECTLKELSGLDNLCAKAERAWRRAAAEVGFNDARGVRITLDKRIPFSAGLGGGSGHAAATLFALNTLHDNLLDTITLNNVAQTVGADVPFFLRGGCALMEGIGETLTPLPALEGWVVLIIPPVPLATADVYRKLDALGLPSRRGTPAMLEAFQCTEETERLSRAAACLSNDMECAAQSLGVDIAHFKDALNDVGALGAAMTGSGSACFGLFHNEAAANEATTLLRDSCRAKNFFAAPLCDANFIVEYR
jgi:4-diphosphocytidyl-2-C-methyl-D-erythritol kinase